MTCFLCAYSVFAYFASCESGFNNSKNVYVINTTIKKASDDPTVVSGILPGMMKYIKSDLPELQAISFTSNLLGTMPRKATSGDKIIEWFRPVVADEKFLNVLDMQMISGNRETALSAPNSMVIGADAAIKLFGSTDVMGKVIHLADIDVTITGVLGPLPVPTHLAMLGSQGEDGKHYVDGLISWQVQERLMMNEVAAQNAAIAPSISFEQMMETIQLPMAMAYITLPTDSNIDVLNKKLNSLIERHFNGRTAANGEDPMRYEVAVVPVRQVMTTFVDSTATLLGVPLKGLLVMCGLIVLSVAIINYANLYTTQLVSHRNELQIQRLMGATRSQLAFQCTIETALVSLAALVLASLLFEPLKIVINANSFVEFDTQWLSGWRYWLVLIGLLATSSILAALYPVMYAMQIKPKQDSRRSRNWTGRSLTHALVATQFSIVGTLLILILVVGQQNSELKKLGIGRIDDPVIVINNNLGQANISYPVLASTLKQYPQVKSIAAANGNLWGQGFSFEPNTISTAKGAMTRHRVDLENISFGFLDTMNMKLLAGRDFDQNRDSTQTQIVEKSQVVIKNSVEQVPNVIVDKSLTEALGYKNADEIVGTELYGHGFNFDRMRVIGVVENSYIGMQGTHNVGTVFMLGKENGLPLIRIDKHDIAGGLQAIDMVWKQLAPSVPVNRQFLKERYATPGIIANAFWILSFLLFLAITISLLGIVGITLHTLARRTREISIRKSLGASNTDVLTLLLSFIARPVVLANIILAWPLGYLISHAYLSLFPYRTALTLWPFVISLTIILSIVLLAIGMQSIKAAKRSPAEVLRHE
jgi:putative ABC transport system permease protein